MSTKQRYKERARTVTEAKNCAICKVEFNRSRKNGRWESLIQYAGRDTCDGSKCKIKHKARLKKGVITIEVRLTPIDLFNMGKFA